jgi:hypothetical protein
MNELRQIKFLTYSLSIAAMLSGWLAGQSIDRYVIEVPGFRHIDIIQWAEYSRHADLGNGLFLYPAEAVISFLLFVISFIIIFMSKQLNILKLPVSFALLLSAAGLFFTIFAAPIILSLKNMPNDALLLQQAFDRFHFWGGLRAIAQVLAFFPALWALGRVFGMNKELIR